jgi:ketosteroid isomerase-like protein
VAGGDVVVQRYLDAIASHRWDVVGECIADDIVRVGPYGDRFAGRDDYMAYLVDTMPKLAGYAMAVHRVTHVGEALAYAELAETVELDGKHMRTAEVLVFAFDDGGRIARVDIFIQTPRPLPS